MHILLIGGTGRTGLLVLQEALYRGHTVTALVRDPSSPVLLTSSPHARLTLVRGSPLDAHDVARAVETASSALHQGSSENQEFIVINTLAARRTSDSPFSAPHPTDSPPQMMADCVRNIISALQTHNQDTAASPSNAYLNSSSSRARLVILSALGSGSSAPQTHPLLRALFRSSGMRHQYRDHDLVEEEVLLTSAAGPAGVGYVLVRPTRLVEEEGGTRVFDVESECTVGMMAGVSRGGVAKFLVDAAESGEYNGQMPILIGV